MCEPMEHGQHHGHGGECGCGEHGERHQRHHGGECGCGRHDGHQRHHRHGGECGCQGPEQGFSFRRRFATREEQIAGLEEYLKELQAEARGVEERIAELKAGG